MPDETENVPSTEASEADSTSPESTPESTPTPSDRPWRGADPIWMPPRIDTDLDAVVRPIGNEATNSGR